MVARYTKAGADGTRLGPPLSDQRATGSGPSGPEPMDGTGWFSDLDSAAGPGRYGNAEPMVHWEHTLVSAPGSLLNWDQRHDVTLSGAWFRIAQPVSRAGQRHGRGGPCHRSQLRGRGSQYPHQGKTPEPYIRRPLVFACVNGVPRPNGGADHGR